MREEVVTMGTMVTMMREEENTGLNHLEDTMMILSMNTEVEVFVEEEVLLSFRANFIKEQGKNTIITRVQEVDSEVGTEEGEKIKLSTGIIESKGTTMI
jgi:hypothetical protein